MNFADRLIAAIKAKNSVVCVGLDPRLNQIPACIIDKAVAEHDRTRKAAAVAFLEFNKGIIDTVKDLCPIVKPQIAFYEQYGSDGLQILGVGIDDPQRLQLSAAELKINYPVLVATAPEMMTVWGNRNQVLPFSAIVDRQGSIRYLHRGQLMPITFERHIKPLLYEQ